MSQFSRLLQTSLLGTAIATVSALMAPAQSSAPVIEFQDSHKVVVDEVWQLVNQHYVDQSFNGTDWKAIRQDLLSRNYGSKDEAYGALNRALAQLQDPYTRFMSPEEYASLSTQTAGELTGIGIQLELNSVTQQLTVIEVMPDSPAIAAGLQDGDQILAINGRSTRKMVLNEASSLIRGEPGTSVNLQVNRNGRQNFAVDIERKLIEFSAVRYSIKEDGGRRLGYIRLLEFNAHAASQLQNAIQALQKEKVGALILDLRGNPGGLLNASIEIARLLLDQGVIVRTVDRDGVDEAIQATNSAITKLPMVLLVDNQSASSSEILAGALQDNKRATIVGSRTFGKALVQSVHELSDGAGVAVTVAHYFTPSGTDISRKGIQPDVLTRLSSEQMSQLVEQPELVATQSDPQYVAGVKSVRRLIRRTQ